MWIAIVIYLVLLATMAFIGPIGIWEFAIAVVISAAIGFQWRRRSGRANA